jgi:Right handed beta helix region
MRSRSASRRCWLLASALALVASAPACGSSGSSNHGSSGGSGGASGGSSGSAGSGGSAGGPGAGGTSNTGGSAGSAGTSGASGSAGSGGAGVTGFTCTQTPPGPLTPTYYVDFAAGSDSNDGRSQATAWKHAPGDSNATGAAAAAQLAPGDVVLFKGGVDYQGSISIGASGGASAPITYDGNSRGTWGTGLAVIDGQETRSSGFSMQNQSHAVIDSFVIKSFTKQQSSVGVSIDGGSNDTVRNCNISDVYYPKDPTPGGTSWEKQFGTGISVNNSPGAVIDHNSVRDVGNAGISFSAESGEVVDNGQISCNEVTNMNWGIAVALGNSTPGTEITGVKVLGNYIHDFDQYYVSNAWHRDGIFVFARPDTDQATVQDLEIAYNYFEDNTSALGSTAWIYLEYVCENFLIHHNVLNDSRSYYAIRILGDGFQVEGDHKIWNNVIDNANGEGDGMHMQESSGISLRNNIFYDDGHAYIVATSSMQGFSADYDLMYRVGGSGPVVSLNAGPAEDPGGDEYDLASLQAQTQLEHHGLYGDPQFSVDPKNIDSDPSGFAPKATSPAIDHGVDLGFTQDFAGKPIPAGAAPDIGAFELQP